MRELRAVVLLMSVAFLTGCFSIRTANRAMRLTVASGKAVDLTRSRLELVKANAVGEDSEIFLPVFIPIPLGMPSIDKSMDAILRETGGDVVLNCVVEYHVSLCGVPMIYIGKFGCRTTGDVYRIVPQGGTSQANRDWQTAR